MLFPARAEGEVGFGWDYGLQTAGLRAGVATIAGNGYSRSDGDPWATCSATTSEQELPVAELRADTATGVDGRLGAPWPDDGARCPKRGEGSGGGDTDYEKVSAAVLGAGAETFA